MSRFVGHQRVSVRARMGVVVVFAATTLVAMTVGAAAGPVEPAASAPAPVNIVAGVHDTAINDCDLSGKAMTADTAAAGESLNNPAFPAGVTTVRVTIPWDVADPTIVNGTALAVKHKADVAELVVIKQCLDAWLQVVFQHGKQPEIDFRSDKGFAEANGQVLMPSLADYTTAMTAFRSQYLSCGSSCADGGQVKVIEPWNEPDNQGQSNVGSTYDLLLYPYQTKTHLAGNNCPASPTVTNCGAVLAANLWATDYRLFEQQGGSGGGACSGCIVPAGDFSAGDGLLTVHGAACPKENKCAYVFLYNSTIAAEGLSPGHWAVHPYTDIEKYQNNTAGATTRLANFAVKLQSYGYGKNVFIWLNEVSACDTPSYDGAKLGTCASYAPGQTQYAQGKVAAVNYLVNQLPLTVPADGPQIGRIDYFCFNGGEAKCNNDWALEDGPVSTTSLNPAGQVFATWAQSH